MREIKFKAWNKWHKNMFHVYCLDFDNDIAGCKSINNGTTHTFGFIDLELLQLTGLKDKNGKDIYEGDIVYLAGYGDCQCEFPFLELYEAVMEDDIGNIIGNIYENPELLNGD